MKKYKLKEKVKMYVNTPNNDAILSMPDWRSRHITREALKEVPQRIELNIVTLSFMEDEPRHMYLKRSTGQWTEQERKDIETFLNDFGSMDKLYEIIEKYSIFATNLYNEHPSDTSFQQWFRGHEKN